MKKLGVAYLLLTLFATLIASAHAFVTIQATIDQNIRVVFDFENINSTIYEEIKQHEPLFNRSTIPQTIVNNLKERNLTRVTYHDPELVFNDADKSIHATFYLSGSDVLEFTFNKTTMAKLYHVRTDWRRFHVNLTDLLSLNFTEYFGTPMAQWQKINYTDFENRVHPAYYHNYTGPSPFDPICYFVLPSTATNVRTLEDTIIFEIPASLEDSLLNSPFLILGALIIVNIAVFLYWKARK